jgi:hypothetical protein
MRPPPLPTALPPDADAKVTELLNKSGVISKYAREQVNDQDIVRLKPLKWLNDEVINFYGALILGRSESSKENPTTNGKAGKGKKPLDVHYFSTFFWTKLEKEGYEKGRLAKWTKKVCIHSFGRSAGDQYFSRWTFSARIRSLFLSIMAMYIGLPQLSTFGKKESSRSTACLMIDRGFSRSVYKPNIRTSP